MAIKKPYSGILSFLIILLSMPIGHAVMILMEKGLGHEHVYVAATGVGFVGVLILLYGIFFAKDLLATILGVISGLLVWTGWIEFAYVYYAHRFGVSDLVVNGEIVTKGEYLIMPSSIGFWAVFMLYYFFGTKTACNFFSWFQRKFKIKNSVKLKPTQRNIAIITFTELIAILWTFYLVLLFSYDDNFLGDRHIATYIIAFGSLFWALILFIRLLKINKLDYAVRYAIPTVIIFWNFVEILGRWNLFKEIWIEPMKYKVEMLLILAVFISLIILGAFRRVKN